jgi:hypothetical protein
MGASKKRMPRLVEKTMIIITRFPVLYGGERGFEEVLWEQLLMRYP